MLRAFGRSLETRNLDKAYRKLAELERPDYKEPKPIKDAIDAFKASKEDVGHGTKRNQRRALDNFLEITKAAGIAKLEDVEIETIDLFRRKRPISATTWTKELAILRNFFSFCVSRKWISFNPAKEVKPPKLKPKPREPYTQDEVIQIVRACDELGNGAYERKRARAMVLLLRYPGLRISEDVAIILGSTPDIIRRHYAQWTIQRQERISSLAQDVWDVRFLSGSKRLPVTIDSKEDTLVDGMGFECLSITENQ